MKTKPGIEEESILRNLPKIALGAWAWGNNGTFGNDFTAEALKPIFDAAMAGGLNLWDTAYAYGMGTSEKGLAEFIRDLPRESYMISDKFTPAGQAGGAERRAQASGGQVRRWPVQIPVAWAIAKGALRSSA